MSRDLTKIIREVQEICEKHLRGESPATFTIVDIYNKVKDITMEDLAADQNWTIEEMLKREA